jgi:hypothetical protein
VTPVTRWAIPAPSADAVMAKAPDTCGLGGAPDRLRGGVRWPLPARTTWRTRREAARRTPCRYGAGTCAGRPAQDGKQYKPELDRKILNPTQRKRYATAGHDRLACPGCLGSGPLAIPFRPGPWRHRRPGCIRLALRSDRGFRRGSPGLVDSAPGQRGVHAMGLSWLTDSSSPGFTDVADRSSYRPRHALAPPYRRLPRAALRLLQATTGTISRPAMTCITRTVATTTGGRPLTSTQPLPRVVA